MVQPYLLLMDNVGGWMFVQPASCISLIRTKLTYGIMPPYMK